MPESLVVPRPLEVALFGHPVWSATVTSADDADAATATLRRSGQGLLVCRAPEGAADAHDSLRAAGARECDQLVTWSRAVLPGESVTSVGPTGLDLAGTSDDASLASLARSAFSGFIGHWHADPRIPADRATELYVRWSLDLLRSATGDEPILVVRGASGALAGFLALRRAHDVVWQVPLTGVAPAHRGRGVLGALLQAAVRHAAEAGGTTMEYETQATNVPAQRALSRLGFAPIRGRRTFHLWADDA